MAEEHERSRHCRLSAGGNISERCYLVLYLGRKKRSEFKNQQDALAFTILTWVTSRYGDTRGVRGPRHIDDLSNYSEERIF